MIVTKENERLYARTIEFNMARVISDLAKIVEEKGGKVKPTNTVLLSDLYLPDSKPISLSHTSYINFVLDGLFYYFEVNNNPFFPFYYLKTPVNENKYSRDACLDGTRKEWLFDYLWSANCSEVNIKAAAATLFSELTKAPNSTIRRNIERTRIPNQYNKGWHYENIARPERFKIIDW